MYILQNCIFPSIYCSYDDSHIHIDNIIRKYYYELLFSDSRLARPVLFSYDIPVYIQFILNRLAGERPVVVVRSALTDTTL